MVRVIEYINKKNYNKDIKNGGMMETARPKRKKKEESARNKKERKKKKEGGQGSSRFSMKKKRQFRLGNVLLWEIHKFQKSTNFLIRKLPFAGWVREIM